MTRASEIRSVGCALRPAARSRRRCIIQNSALPRGIGRRVEDGCPPTQAIALSSTPGSGHGRYQRPLSTDFLVIPLPLQAAEGTLSPKLPTFEFWVAVSLAALRRAGVAGDDGPRLRPADQLAACFSTRIAVPKNDGSSMPGGAMDSSLQPSERACPSSFTQLYQCGDPNVALAAVDEPGRSPPPDIGCPPQNSAQQTIPASPDACPAAPASRSQGYCREMVTGQPPIPARDR